VVNEEIPLLDMTSATLGGTLSNQQINDLPLNGRNYENLLQLRPGVTRYPGGGFSTTSTNGLRAEDNGYIMTACSTATIFWSRHHQWRGHSGRFGDHLAYRFHSGIQPARESVGGVRLEARRRGHVGLKSGTNGLHGTAFIFGRDGAMDARNYFNCANNPCAVGQSPSPKNPRTLEQFGASVGGPIIKDKAFFFGAYEGQRYDVGNQFGGVTSPSMVPMPDAGNCLVLSTGDCGKQHSRYDCRCARRFSCRRNSQ